MDIFLLVMTIIIGVLLVFANIYILGVYCHPEDNGFGANLLCKITVVAGLTLCWGQVLLVPLDVSNSRGYGSGFNMEIMWYVVYISVLVFLAFLIPVLSFYYESDEDKSFLTRVCTTIAMEFVMLLLMGVFLTLFYLFCSTVYLPVRIITFSLNDNGTSSAMLSSEDTISDTYFTTNIQVTQDVTATFTVSLYVSIMASLAFLGIFFLVLFAGMGMSALPIDLIRSYRTRPTFTSSKQAFSKKAQLKKQCSTLMELGDKIQEDQFEVKYQKGFWAKRKIKNKYAADFQVFSEAVLQLEDEHQLFKMELSIGTVNPLVFYGKLFIGFIGIIISLVWWAHILVAVVIKKDGYPLFPLLDKAFLRTEEIGVDFVGIALFAMFSLYLLWCAMKGNFKIGLAIPFMFTIHPMRPNETWMNSFLFNLNLMLVMGVAVVQLVAKCFIQYVRFSELSQIFNFQVYYLEFYKIFYQNNVFEIAILVWSGLSMIYFLAKAQTKPQIAKDIELQKKKMKKKYKGPKDVEMQELLIKKEKKGQESAIKESKAEGKKKNKDKGEDNTKQETDQNLQKSNNEKSSKKEKISEKKMKDKVKVK